MEKKLIRTHRDLDVYKMAFEAAMQIFEKSKSFLKEELLWELSSIYDNILGKIVSLINNPKQWLLPGAKLR